MHTEAGADKTPRGTDTATPVCKSFVGGFSLFVFFEFTIKTVSLICNYSISKQTGCKQLFPLNQIILKNYLQTRIFKLQ